MNRTKNNKGSISKQLVKSYLFLFPFFLLLIGIIAIIGSIVSHSLLAPLLPTHEFNLEEYMKDDISKIDIANLIDSDGGGAIVFGDGRIKELAGDSIFDKTHITKKEWTEFLTDISDPNNKEIYSITYNEKEDFWLVVSTPVPLRLYISLTGNTNSSNFITALIFYSVLIIAMFLLLLVGILLYAKKSSNSFVVPLRKLCEVVNNISNGKYNNETDNNYSGEFLSLSNDIFKLSAELRQEKILREKLESDKKQILLDISHDLRNPLATIMGYAETLKNANVTETSKQAHYLEVIYNNSIRANHLMDELFVYTKLDAPTLNLVLEEYDICEFLREQISLFLPQFELNGINTRFEIPDKEIYIKIDKVLLSRAFSNLIGNCIKYNKAPITFTLLLEDKNEEIQIILIDDGIGIDEKFKETIFEPFIRADASRNSKTGGSGLGLAIVKKIITAHKGSITLDTKLGKGCIFTIKLKKEAS